mgnify:CR=1 FL=1
MTLGKSPITLHDEPILKIDRLVTAFQFSESFFKKKEFFAVNDISLDLSRSKTLAIVGESGCGKTTLGKTIVNLIPAKYGQIHFKGFDISNTSNSMKQDLRQNIQIVFQDPYSSLDPRYSVHDIVAEPLKIHGRYDLKKIEEVMGWVGLSPSYLDMRPSQFSGGQRQRIAIARALVLNPEIIILDEPVSALDVSIQAQVLNLLKELQRKLGLSYLFISHNLGVVRYIADEVAVMYLGRIVESGPTEAIFERPLHPYTRALLSAVPIASPFKKDRRERIILRGDPPNPLYPPKGCSFHTRCYQARSECSVKRPELVRSDKEIQHKVSCFFPHE